MKRTKKQAPALPKVGCTYQPAKKTTRSWKDCPVPDGANETPVESFAHTAAFILANQQTFSIQDFYSLLSHKGLDPEAVQGLYARWTKEAQAQGKIREIPSCYNQAVFNVV